MITMASPRLSGTLSERHKCFNEAVNKLCSEKKTFEEVDDFSPKNDIDHLIKIDAANHFKVLDYIFQILRSDDNLLKSRALKCVWLFDGSEEYSKLSYLNENLFPFISNNTKCKVIYNLGIHLKNEKYAEEYFDHFFVNDNHQHALKFLPSCSTKFIENVFDTADIKITATQMYKITEKELNLSYKFFNTKKRRLTFKSHFPKVASLMVCADTERFLNWFEYTLIPEGVSTSLGLKASTKIMKCSKRRVIDNIDKYTGLLKRSAIISVLSRDEIKEVLLKLLPRKETDFKNQHQLFFAYTKQLKQDEQNDLLKDIFKSFFGIEIPNNSLFYQGDWRKLLNQNAIQEWALSNVNTPWLTLEQPRLFMWYSYVDFEIAFPRLREYTKSEPQAKERMIILTVMIDSYCRKRREEDLTKLLQYFLKFHVNEQLKSDFLNKLLDHTVIYKYNEESWSIINEIFHSFDVYDGKDVSYSNHYLVSRCQLQVIKRQILEGTPIPEKILQSYIDSHPSYYVDSKDDLNITFEKKVFEAVSNALLKKFMSSENRVKGNLFNIIVSYFTQWNEKHPKHIQYLATFKPIIEYMNTDNLYFYPVTSYLKTDPNLLRDIFEIKLLNEFSTSMSLYCLKHRPELFNGSNEEIIKTMSECWCDLKAFFRKIRTYFADELGKFWEDHHLKSVADAESKNLKLRNSISALSVLLERDKFVELIKPYKPAEAKIQWSEIDKVTLERSKLLAKYSHFVRPLLPPDIILSFTKGDYLQHILTSLTSLCYQYPLLKTKEIVMILIDSPVSVQKHGIRMLMTLFDSKDTTKMIMDIWSKTKNVSIRFVILQYLIKIMVKVHQSETRDRYWQCLNVVIGQLSGEGDDKLFEHLSDNVANIHKENLTDYCQRSWHALKTFNNHGYILKFLSSMRSRQIDLDGDFCTYLIKEYIESNFDEEPNFENEYLQRLDVEMLQFIVQYLLFVKEEYIQNERIHLAYGGLTTQLKKFWKNDANKSKTTKEYYVKFLKNILLESFSLPSEYINPKIFLSHILADMSTFLPISEGFNPIILTKLVCLHHEIFDPLRKMHIDYNQDLNPELLGSISESWQVFGRRSGDLLNELIENYFPQISILFQNVLEQFVNLYLHYGCVNINLTEDFLLLNIINGLLSHEDHIYPCLAGVQILPKKVDDKLSKPVHAQILKQLRESKKQEYLLFLNMYLDNEI